MSSLEVSDREARSNTVVVSWLAATALASIGWAAYDQLPAVHDLLDGPVEYVWKYSELASDWTEELRLAHANDKIPMLDYPLGYYIKQVFPTEFYFGVASLLTARVGVAIVFGAAKAAFSGNK